MALDIPIGLAFLAGLASFLSPCVLSLVPAYVSYLGGRAVGGETAAKNRWITFSHGIAFVLGFSLVFVLFNIIGFGIGRTFYDAGVWLSRIGGAIVVVFGLHMTGVIRIPFLEYDTRVQKLPDPRYGYFSSVLMGVVFSAGWSPCTGPTLGSIIMLSAVDGSLPKAIGLGLTYSAGLGIPFLAAALGIGWVTAILRRHADVMRKTEIVMGVLLIIIGVLLMFGLFNIIANIFPGWTFDI